MFVVVALETKRKPRKKNKKKTNKITRAKRRKRTMDDVIHELTGLIGDMCHLGRKCYICRVRLTPKKAKRKIEVVGKLKPIVLFK